MAFARLLCGATVVAVALWLQGCGSDDDGTADVPTSECSCFDRRSVNAVAIYHGEKESAFWTSFKQTAEVTASRLGISMDAVLFEEFSDDLMAATVEEKASQWPSFMIVTLPGPKTIAAVKNITGIPVFAVNVGYEQVEAIDSVVSFIGQDEEAAGALAADKLIEALPTMAMGIFIRPQGDAVATAARSVAFKSAMDTAGRDFMEIEVDEGNAAHVKAVLAQNLTQAMLDGKVGILVAGDGVLVEVLDRLEELAGGAGFSNSTAVLAFDDSSADAHSALKDGKIIGVLQQGAFLQAWLPVVLGALKDSTDMELPQKVMRSGPAIVTEPLTEERLRCSETAECPWEAVEVTMLADAVEGDRFWDIVENGARAAARDLGVNLQMPRMASFDIEEMYQAVSDFSMRNTTGPLGVALPTPGFFNSLVRSVAAKTPTLTLNSGGDFSEALGAVNHLGQDEVEAGRQAGAEMLLRQSCKKAVCIVYSRGLKSLTDRCAGFKAALGSAAAEEYVEVKLDENETLMEEDFAAMLAEQEPDCVLLTSASRQWLPYSAAAGNASNVTVGVFDVMYGVAEALEDGTISFVVDQQGYLQGYATVALLAASALTGQHIQDHYLKTGPIFKYSDGAAAVACQDAGFPICGVEDKAAALRGAV